MITMNGTPLNLEASAADSMLKQVGAATALLKQLANENRLLILCSLVSGELSVGELNERLPLSQSALSQHLASLRQAELVQTRRQGQTIYYQLCGSDSQQTRNPAIAVIETLQAIYCPEH
jgi:DNA-binding transcriptional ArsR family regulator